MTASKVLLLIVTAAALACVSCLERSENITIAGDGTATIRVSFSGDLASFEAPTAIPAPPEWRIVKQRIDSTGTDNPRMDLTAEMTVPYGHPLPSTFAAPGAADRDLNLQFPTTIRTWTEGSRTYYEFTRTYKARRFRSYEVTETDPIWDEDLEKRVLENGIFSVSEQDRTKYIDNFGFALAYHRWRMHRDAAAVLFESGTITDSTLHRLGMTTADWLDSTLTSDLLLGILGQPDDRMGPVLDSLIAAVDSHFVQSVKDMVPPEGVPAYREARARIQKAYDITEALGRHDFSINVVMPGTILETNGLIGPEDPGEVTWWFSGNKLHDADLPLYVRSVVQN